MPLDATTGKEYARRAQQQQQLYAFWLADGDTARARLALDVANWFYLQLGWPYYYPSDFPGYTPSPTSPDAGATIAASLPVLSLGITGPVAADQSGSGSTAGSGSGLQAHDVGGGAAFDDAAGLAAYCAYYPDDPICYGQGFAGFGGEDPGSGPVYISEPTTIVINQQGATLADVASRISGALASAAAAIATATDAALAAAIGGIQRALNAIGNELASVFGLLSRLIGKVLQFLKGLLLDVIHALVAAVKEIGTLLKDVVQNVLMPALQALQHLRDYLIKIYEKFLRPLLVMLQDVRKVLAILRVFHIGFAQKLDNVLADIQSKISTPLLYLLRYTNAVANYINLILDARLFIQKPLFLASLNAYKGSAISLQLNAMNPKPDPAAVAALQASAATLSPAANVTALNQFLQDGGGPMADSIAQQSALFDGYLQQGVQ